VTTDQLGDKAVTTGQLGDSAVTTGQLADNAITTAKLINSAVKLKQAGEWIGHRIQARNDQHPRKQRRSHGG
jgi:hypothetical protein